MFPRVFYFSFYFLSATTNLVQWKFDFLFRMLCKETTKISPLTLNWKWVMVLPTFPFSTVCQSAEIILHTKISTLPKPTLKFLVVFCWNKSWNDSFIGMSETLIFKENLKTNVTWRKMCWKKKITDKRKLLDDYWGALKYYLNWCRKREDWKLCSLHAFIIYLMTLPVI